MDAAQLHAIERECTAVLTKYRRHLDRHEFEQASTLFTPDVDWNMDGDRFVGREENVTAMNDFIGELVIRHVFSNMIVTATDADHATATYYMVMYRHRKADMVDGKVSRVGPNHFLELEDKFVRTQEGWRIARRDCTTVLRDATSVPTPTESQAT